MRLSINTRAHVMALKKSEEGVVTVQAQDHNNVPACSHQGSSNPKADSLDLDYLPDC